jgi:hypothetical protein
MREDAAAMPDDLFPVRWAGRQAIVTFPAHIGVSNASQLSDRLLAVINRDAEVLAGDLARGVVAEQPQVTRDLLDRVVGRDFQVGLDLQAASGLPVDVLRRAGAPCP